MDNNGRICLSPEPLLSMLDGGGELPPDLGLNQFICIQADGTREDHFLNARSVEFDNNGLLHYGDSDNIYSWDGNSSTALLTAPPIQGTLNLQGTTGGETIFQSNYERDLLGRIIVKEEGTDSYAYQYDLTGRLTQVQLNGVAIETYGYDANNNHTHKNGAVIGSYDDQDRLLTYQNNSYSYTENGELKTKTNSGVSTLTATIHWVILDK